MGTILGASYQWSGGQSIKTSTKTRPATSLTPPQKKAKSEVPKG